MIETATKSAFLFKSSKRGTEKKYRKTAFTVKLENVWIPQFFFFYSILKNLTIGIGKNEKKMQVIYAYQLIYF